MGWWDPGGPPSTGDPAPGERSPAAGGLRQRLQRRARCERHVRRLGRSGPGEKGTNDRVGARPPRCPDVRTVTASPAWRSRAPRTGDVTTMRRRTAELGRRRRPQPKTSIGPGATSQDNQPTNHAMAITQIHTHRRNRHGSWRDGEGGALDALRPLGYFSERRRRIGGSNGELLTQRYAFPAIASSPAGGTQRQRSTATPTSTPARGRNAISLASLVAS